MSLGTVFPRWREHVVRLRPYVARFRPRLLDSLQTYSATRLIKDIGAGITVGVVALPLATAFAIASGVKPEAGLTTAIIGGFLIAALGGTRVQIGGPAGAFIVIVYGIVERYGLSGLLISTTCAGVLLFLMGLFRLGQLIRFVPVSIVIGFTNGIAMLVILSQFKEALGLAIPKMPAQFFQQVQALFQYLHTVNLWAVLVCALSLLIVVLWPRRDTTASRAGRVLSAVPGAVIALVLSSAGVWFFNLPVETISSRFGSVPQALPQFVWPEFSWEQIQQLFAPTITIALLCAVESLLCARTSDYATGDRHDSNQELMAQGIANTCVPFFGGIPVTGTIARTMTNVKSGATSPIAGMVHALTLLIIVLVAAPLADAIPLAGLAGILLFVGWNMGEWREFARLKNFSTTYRITLLSTFVLTVVMDLTVAVQVGLLLSALFFIYRIASLTRLERVQHITLTPMEAPQPVPNTVAAYRMFGSLFFGSVTRLEELTETESSQAPKVLLLDLTPLLSLDSSGIEALETLNQALRQRGCQLVIGGASGQPLALLQRSGFIEEHGTENFSPDLAQAWARALYLAATSPD